MARKNGVFPTNSVTVNFLLDPQAFGAVFTGSVAFGISTDKSDVDMFIKKKDFDKATDGDDRFIDGDEYEDSEFYLARYEYNNKSYDIFVMNSETFDAWDVATKSFKEAVADRSFVDLIKDKVSRFRLFESIKKAVKDTIVPF